MADIAHSDSDSDIDFDDMEMQMAADLAAAAVEVLPTPDWHCDPAAFRDMRGLATYSFAPPLAAPLARAPVVKRAKQPAAAKQGNSKRTSQRQVVRTELYADDRIKRGTVFIRALDDTYGVGVDTASAAIALFCAASNQAVGTRAISADGVDGYFLSNHRVWGVACLLTVMLNKTGDAVHDERAQAFLGVLNLGHNVEQGLRAQKSPIVLARGSAAADCTRQALRRNGSGVQQLTERADTIIGLSDKPERNERRIRQALDALDRLLKEVNVPAGNAGLHPTVLHLKLPALAEFAAPSSGASHRQAALSRSVYGRR